MERELGRGGMGVVYAVVHSEIGKRAALKVMHDRWADKRNADRILLEARVVNAVSHPNIVDIFETGALPDGRAYIVMERLEGEGLLERAYETKLLPPLVIEILMQVCEALAAAHAADIVHRDLKPDNVFLVDSGDADHPRVKLLDWGIAKMMSGEVRRTLDGQVIGTPQYLSPEQARGGKVTPMSDVYSLGVMAYELFTEQPPFESTNAVELLAMHLNAPPMPPRELWPDMPQDLEDLLLQMLAKDPDDRPRIVDVIAKLTAVREHLTARTSGQRASTAPAAPALPVAAQAIALVPGSTKIAKVDRSIAHAQTDRMRTQHTRPRRRALAFAAFAAVAIGCAFAISHTRDASANEAASMAGAPLAGIAPAPMIAPTATLPAASAATGVLGPSAPSTTLPAPSAAPAPVAKPPVKLATDTRRPAVPLSAASAAATSTMMRRNQHSTGDVRKTSAAVVRPAGARRIERDGMLTAY